MYAAWDKPKQKIWLAQVVSVNKNRTYKLFYADNYVRDEVPSTQIRRPTKRQLTDKLVGKKFFDEGDPVTNTRGQFKKGEFVVLLKETAKGGSYWCERETNIQEERHIEKFSVKYVTELIAKYDNEWLMK